MLYAPDSLVSTMVSTPVCVLTAVTSTPGIRAAVGSSTIPVKTLLPSWAHSGVTRPMHSMVATRNRHRMADSPPRGSVARKNGPFMAAQKNVRKRPVCIFVFRVAGADYTNSMRTVKLPATVGAVYDRPFYSFEL